MSLTLITSEHLTLAYDGIPVATGIDFAVNEGDYLCIVGENGSGKSTLVKAILGLHPVADGQLTVSEEARRAGIGYLPQQTPAQRDFPASVKEIVLSGCLHRAGMSPFWSREHRRLAKEAMERMGIDGLASRCYRELSGGQQQRVLLARAYCAAGKILILDEPIAGLDPLAMTEMYRMIADMNREGVAVVMVSHDVEAAVSYADHILHVSKTTTFFGTTEAYLKTPVGQQFAHRERGGYGDWSPEAAWDAPDTRDILDARMPEARIFPDARSVLGARAVANPRSVLGTRGTGKPGSQSEPVSVSGDSKCGTAEPKQRNRDNRCNGEREGKGEGSV